MVAPLLRAEKLQKYFPVSKGVFRAMNEQVRAADGISFDTNQGETLGLVGEPGCRKTTTSKLILRLIQPTSREVVLEGRNIRHFKGNDLKKY
jgi:peptide/nickel transport system ATP-binding protein